MHCQLFTEALFPVSVPINKFYCTFILCMHCARDAFLKRIWGMLSPKRMQTRAGVGIGKSYFQQSVVSPRQSQHQRILKLGGRGSRYHLVCFFIHSFKYSTNIYWAVFMYQDLNKAKVGRYSHSLLHR